MTEQDQHRMECICTWRDGFDVAYMSENWGGGGMLESPAHIWPNRYREVQTVGMQRTMNSDKTHNAQIHLWHFARGHDDDAARDKVKSHTTTPRSQRHGHHGEDPLEGHAHVQPPCSTRRRTTLGGGTTRHPHPHVHRGTPSNMDCQGRHEHRLAWRQVEPPRRSGRATEEVGGRRQRRRHGLGRNASWT